MMRVTSAALGGILCVSVAVGMAGAQPAPMTRATSTVAFETSSGTWMSLDAVPGGAIVIELLGDLHLIPSGGGPTRRLTDGPAFDAMPRLLPDGRTLVFVSDRDGGDNLWVIGVDGSGLRQVTRERHAVLLSPTPTPDGRAVLVTVTQPGLARTADLWRYDLATGTGTRVLENRAGPFSPLNASPAPGPYGAAVTPDGMRAITAMVAPRPYGSRAGASSRLWQVELASGRAEPMVVEGSLPVVPVLSPDARQLVYGAQEQGRTGLRVRDLVTGAERRLVARIDQDELESRATRDLLPRGAFTPDARAFVVAYGGAVHVVDLASGRDSVVPFRASVSATVPMAPRRAPPIDRGAVDARILTHPAVSRDGRIAVSAFARVWVTDRDGVRLRRATRDSAPREFFPAWSPDARQLAYTTWGPSGGALWLTTPDSPMPPRRLTETGAWHAEPSFSADGTRLVALRAPAGTTRRREGPWPVDAELIVVTLSTGAVQRLGSAGPLRRPRFSRDGAAVIAMAPGVGAVRIALSDGRRTTLAGWRDAPRGPGMRAPDHGTLLDDGSLALVASGDSLLLVPPARDSAGSSTFDPRRGAVVLSADAPEGFGTSDDGTRLTWSTGTWVHRRWPAGGAWVGDSLRLVPTLARAAGRGTIVLRGVTAITMRGAEVVADADVVVTDDRIASVGPRGPVPAGATVRELPGAVVVPGYIDTHAHWLPSPAIPEPDASAPFATLAHGITTVRDPSAPTELFAMADQADAGVMPSPRVFTTGLAVLPDRAPADAAAADRLVQRYAERWRSRYLKMYLTGDRQQRRWIADAGAARGLLVTTEGGSDLRQNLTHVLDGFAGHEHAYPSTPLGDDAVQWLARSRIAYTPTLLVAFGGPLPIYRELAARQPVRDAVMQRWAPPEELYRRTATRGLAFFPDDYRDASHARDAKRVHDAGGLVAVGGHGEVHGMSFHWELELLAQGGFTPHELLRLATMGGAEALGLHDELGSLEPGKRADLVVLSRDPRLDIANARAVQAVMRNGELFEATTLARTWPTAAPGPVPWWQREASMPGAVDTRAIDATVRRLMDAQRVPGVAVAVVQRGVPVHVAGYGVADLEQGTAVTPATMFQSGSLGKQFTAAGVLALVDQGKVALDASVRRYLREAPATWEPVTIRHLLTHTAGMPDYTSAAFDYRRDYADSALVAMAAALPLEFVPGQRWNYSNTGYVVLGVVIARVTGRPYWDVLREAVFTPAGMPTARVITDSAIVPHRAAGYEVAGATWRHQRWVSPTLNTTADGSLLLSLQDLLAWNDAVRRGTVLSAARWSEMLSPVTLRSGRTFPYGFGWFADSAGGAPLWQHGGAWQGFMTQYSRFARGEVDVIVLANARSASPEAIANAVAAIVEPALGVAPPAGPVPPDAAADRAVRQFVTRAVAQQLTPADFVHFRMTVLPRAIALLHRVFQGAGPLTGVEAVRRTMRGDDRAAEYRLRFGTRTARLYVELAEDGRVTGVRPPTWE